MTTPDSSFRQSLTALRIVVAGLLFIHGLYRLLAGGVAPFGEYLTTQQIPMGPAIAWGITLFEIMGAPVLAIGWLITPIALLFSIELAAGIAMVHAPEGWFVVGGGRNGAEYSVALITILLAIGWADWNKRRGPDQVQ